MTYDSLFVPSLLSLILYTRDAPVKMRKWPTRCDQGGRGHSGTRVKEQVTLSETHPTAPADLVKPVKPL